MALFIAVVVILVTIVSLVLFGVQIWWFPEVISAYGLAIDRQFKITFIITGIIFVLAELGLAYLVWCNRDRGDGHRAKFFRGHNKLELFWTGLAAVIFLGLSFMGYRLWAQLHFTGSQPGAMQIEVWGEQFAWSFRYPGPDGKFGKAQPRLMADGTGNTLGLDREKDEAARDDLITTTLAVPVNHPIELTLRSKDVTHSLFVRELRLKQDLVPGMEIPIHFTANKVGKYEIACAELCGMGHFGMKADLLVMTDADFQKWLSEEAGQSE